jgi:excisionase family DNA binding protein
MNNPFEIIDRRLTNIECLLLELLSKKREINKEESTELMTIDEVAIFLRLSKSTIYTLCSRKKLPYLKRAKKFLFERNALIEFMKSNP